MLCPPINNGTLGFADLPKALQIIHDLGNQGQVGNYNQYPAILQITLIKSDGSKSITRSSMRAKAKSLM